MELRQLDIHKIKTTIFRKELSSLFIELSWYLHCKSIDIMCKNLFWTFSYISLICMAILYSHTVITMTLW